jgi:glycosyltransferase involved in cell wall biosynthesis
MPTPGLADVAAAVCRDIPFILTYHTGTMKKGQRLPDALIWAYERFLLPRILHKAQTIICSSDFVRNSFLAPYHYKSITITPGVNEQLFHPVAQASSTAKTMLFVGNYGPSYQHKGLADAIQVLGGLKDLHPTLELHIAGTGQDTEYRQLAVKLGVEHRVKFLGWQENSDLANIYPTATLIILPSKNDSFPLVLVDAMACGVPVVSTTVGGIPTVIESEITGLLSAPGDIDGLTNAANRILSDDQLATRLGHAGRQKVLSDLTWTQKVIATATTYERAGLPHVCQITPYYPPHIGGVENVVKELSSHLAQLGYRVDVVTSQAPEEPSASAPSDPPIRLHRLRGISLLHTPILPSLLWTLLQQPASTIYHLHVAQAGLPEVAYLAARLKRRPLIAHIHLDIEPSGPIGKLILNPYKRFILRHVLAGADKVVVLTADQAELLTRKYRLDPRRVMVLPNGVAAQYYLPPRTSMHNPLRLLFVGRLAIQKRPERIVEAMAALPNITLDVVGDGPDRSALEAYVARNGLTNVTFHGTKRNAELRQFYQNADILVLPSDKEGMPLTLLEAMASSLPIVGSDVLGIHELIEGIGILVEHPSPAAFANAISTLAANPSQLTRLSGASRHASIPYSWTRLTSQVTKLYAEVSK